MSEQPAAQIVIADDHPLFRGALRQTLVALIPGVKIMEAGSFEEVESILARDPVIDLVLLDLSIPGARHLSGLMYIKAEYPEIPVVIVSANDDPVVMRRCMHLGAAGFVPKALSAADIGKALETVLAGGTWAPPQINLSAPMDHDLAEVARRVMSLTPQQVRVLMMLTEGLLNKQIAYALDVSEATVKAHVSAILQKLEVESRTQAVILMARLTGLGGGGSSPL